MRIYESDTNLRISGQTAGVYSRHSLFYSRNSHRDRGFTLVEMIVAVGIFAVIMVMATGSLLSLLQANYKAQALKTAVNNLHFTLENMSRNIRTGTNYHCGFGTIESGGEIIPADCPVEPSIQLVFKDRDGDAVAYRWTGSGDIERAKHTDASQVLLPGNFVPITAPEVRIEQLRFFVDGADNAEESGNNKEQPRVLIVMKGFMQGKGKVATRFDIETLVSQRQLDI